MFGPTDSNLLPDAAKLDVLMTQRHSERCPVKMVTVVNPGNPTGLIIPESVLLHISEVCKKHGAWLVVDNTYEVSPLPHVEPPIVVVRGSRHPCCRPSDMTASSITALKLPIFLMFSPFLR